MPDGNQPLSVFAIEENGGKDKSYRHEVGVAFRNQDGSLNLKLYMLPLLKLQIRNGSRKTNQKPCACGAFPLEERCSTLHGSKRSN